MISATKDLPDEIAIGTSPRVSKSGNNGGSLEVLGSIPANSENTEKNVIQPISIKTLEIRWPAKPNIQPLKKKVVRNPNKMIELRPFASILDTEMTVQSIRQFVGLDFPFPDKNKVTAQNL